MRIYADYYDKFRCKCGDCRHVCCGGWGITVSDNEYFRLLGLDCPAELRSSLDVALAMVDDPSPERYAMMKPSYTGKCRLINDAGLCSLQIACGEEVLPAVCRAYPRSFTEEHAGCSASCERVVELLMRREPLFFSAPLPEPMASYVYSLSPLCGQLPRGGSPAERSLRERIASILPDVFPRGQTCSCFALLGTYIENLSAAFPNFAETVYEEYKAYADAPDGEKRLYNDISAFDGRFPDAQRWYENLIVNRMFITDFPGDDIKAALCGVVCEYALLRFVSAKCGTEEQFVDRVSSLYRFIGHTNFNKNSAAAINRAGAYSADGLSALLIM